MVVVVVAVVVVVVVVVVLLLLLLQLNFLYDNKVFNEFNAYYGYELI